MNKIHTILLFAIFFMAPAAKACTLTTSVMSTSPVSPCSYSCNGMAVIMVTGGTAPYTASGSFTASPVSFSSAGTLTGFCMGTFPIVITDAVGCTTTMTVTIGGPSALSFSTSTSPSSPACDGSITVTASGGTGTLTYSNDGGLSYQSSNVFSGLCTGTYNVCVMDANGCTTCSNVTVSSSCTFISTVGGVTGATCNGVCNG
ncbi:MAG TPA: hypothetical protein VD905_08860, partial [Flavobacteriales bacterium]|nr:hypothetical protein [Flavobacteriales bacterium]